jgi:hypothetical protein
MNLVAIFYHKSQDQPIVMNVSEPSKFLDLCDTFPTTWGYLFDKDKGTVLDTYKHNPHSENSK